ncbi:MAG: hypothetical protein KAV87_63030 [Desulfobacteraceae bacterium]|nr:hypothetical protein [Desulfobacteraceae bacterium]
MTDEEKHDELHKTLELIIPAFGKLKLSEARALIDRINDCLAETPFMYVICAEGVQVFLRAQIYQLNKAMFDTDTFRDDRETKS